MEMVLKTIEKALELGISPIKLNCVVIKNLNDAEVLDFVEMTRDKPIEVRFIAFMPFAGSFLTYCGHVGSDGRESMGFRQNRLCKDIVGNNSTATSEY